jgi:hypothetical protein
MMRHPWPLLAACAVPPALIALTLALSPPPDTAATAPRGFEPLSPQEEEQIGWAECRPVLEAVQRRILAKERLVHDLTAGRLSLPRAAEELRELDAAAPAVDVERLRRHVEGRELSAGPLPVRRQTAAADWSEDEVYWRWLLHRVRDGGADPEALRQLCPAFDARFGPVPA